ncbi:MAG: L-serine ammonia-lyase, iron-sulfur-dependent, subunit alpha [Eubacteriales bacterium]|nr:L-serine ammonia-lyase, iron-sulfur-dependent, subunit alpha [Eubacteriales bacterium]
MEAFEELLLDELVPAMGCTEPIAIALAGAAAGQLAEEEPQKILIYASGSMIKNANSVFVPASGGRKGMLIATALGVLTKSPDKKLEVLTAVTEDILSKAVKLIDEGKVVLHHEQNSNGVYVKVRVETQNHFAEATVEKEHDNISRLVLDGKVIKEPAQEENTETQTLIDSLNFETIKDFADNIDFAKHQELYLRLKKMAEYNLALAHEGLNNPWGQQVGRTILKSAGEDIFLQAVAHAAAGSDARMAGCELPAMICCGSGNQGITSSVPVVYLADKLGMDEEKMLRAMVFSTLTTLYQKQFIGKLSAFCGAISAATGAACAIAYMLGESLETIEGVLTNSLAASGGIVCDGAKPSCAMKIATGLNTGLLSIKMAKDGNVFKPLDGLVGKTTDTTVRNIGEMAREGMTPTDKVILNIITRQANN